MNYLSDYTSENQTKLLNDNGAFFAFSTKQLNEHKKEGVVYVSMGSGLISPKVNISHTVEALEDYGITRAQVSEEYPDYFQHCIDNDYF